MAGRVWQPDRDRFRRWLSHDVARRADRQPVAMAVEGCTGSCYVVEEIVAAGFEARVAEPADTQAARGRKHRAKTDRCVTIDGDDIVTTTLTMTLPNRSFISGHATRSRRARRPTS